jgi:hypothetical protein
VSTFFIFIKYHSSEQSIYTHIEGWTTIRTYTHISIIETIRHKAVFKQGNVLLVFHCTSNTWRRNGMHLLKFKIGTIFFWAMIAPSVQRLGYGLDDRDSRVRFPAGARNFSLHHRVQNGSGVHPAFYPVSTRGSFPEGKPAGAWSWPLTSI